MIICGILNIFNKPIAENAIFSYSILQNVTHSIHRIFHLIFLLIYSFISNSFLYCQRFRVSSWMPYRPDIPWVTCTSSVPLMIPHTSLYSQVSVVRVGMAVIGATRQSCTGWKITKSRLWWRHDMGTLLALPFWEQSEGGFISESASNSELYLTPYTPGKGQYWWSFVISVTPFTNMD